LEKLIREDEFIPVIKQLTGDKRWAVRIRFYEGKPVLHFMNTALVAVPHPIIKDNSGTAVLKDIETKITDNKLSYRINRLKVPLNQLSVMSPETNGKVVKAEIQHEKKYSVINLNLEGVKVYAVAQSSDVSVKI